MHITINNLIPTLKEGTVEVLTTLKDRYETLHSSEKCLNSSFIGSLRTKVEDLKHFAHYR